MRGLEATGAVPAAAPRARLTIDAVAAHSCQIFIVIAFEVSIAEKTEVTAAVIQGESAVAELKHVVRSARTAPLHPLHDVAILVVEKRRGGCGALGARLLAAAWQFSTHRALVEVGVP